MEKQQLVIYNTLSRKKEIFEPLNAPNVGMYVCGPTVYGDPHLGHARPSITFDILFRYLKHLGYKVRYVRNITDVGHLEHDADEGDDKIEKKARLEQLEPMEIAQHYTNRYHDAMNALNVLPPSIEPQATGHIIEQEQLVKEIMDNGFAYESNGSIYFDTAKYNQKYHYGKLSGRNLDDVINASRELGGVEDKRNQTDFALWKKASPAHIMRWASPWGDGFPGWHLECTVMSTKYLGDQFDIHGGGMDLKFPHHECEIAQGKAGHGQSPVRYWMHANMLTMNGQRMSKSTGNYILPMQLISGDNTFFEKPFAPAVIRFCFMQAHYRSVLDISNEAMLAAEKGFNRLMEAIKILNELTSEIEHPGPLSSEIEQWKQKCYDALLDDFNAPILIAHLFEAVKWIFQVKSGEEKISIQELEELRSLVNAFVFDVLGLKNEELNAANNDRLDGVLQLLIDMRMEARANKDFALSDKIRDELLALGIQLKDGKEGTSYSLN